jgi:hypothetical protein
MGQLLIPPTPLAKLKRIVDVQSLRVLMNFIEEVVNDHMCAHIYITHPHPTGGVTLAYQSSLRQMLRIYPL